MNTNDRPSKSPTISLTASYDICAAHQLNRTDWDAQKNRAAFGHCADLHGHQYKLEVTLEGEIPAETGMIINGYEVDRIVREKIMSRIDHKFLNKDIPFFSEKLPTAEWIAVWAFGELKNAFPSACRLAKVRIYETPNLYAEYAGS